MRGVILGLICALCACMNIDELGRDPVRDPIIPLPPPRDGGSESAIDRDGAVEPPDPPPVGYGRYQSLAPVTMGLAFLESSEDDFAVTLTEAHGGTGCALVADEHGAPGVATGLVIAKLVEDDRTDSPCPEGHYAIRNEPEVCGREGEGIPPGCALYKHWDQSGRQDAAVLAIGGSVTVRSTFLDDDSTQCNVDVSLSFGQEQQITLAFSYIFSPLGTADTFCVQ